MQTAKFSIGQLVDAWYAQFTGHGHTLQVKEVNIVGTITAIDTRQGGVSYTVDTEDYGAVRINQSDIEQAL